MEQWYERRNVNKRFKIKRNKVSYKNTVEDNGI